MSWSCDSTELFAGAWLTSAYPGLGVPGSLVPSSGDSGPAYLYNDLALPADANAEVTGRILSWPSAGTLTVNEDSSFIFSGASDGSYSFTYQARFDGVDIGSPRTVTLIVGG
jgi:hypothetical protein